MFGITENKLSSKVPFKGYVIAITNIHLKDNINILIICK